MANPVNFEDVRNVATGLLVAAFLVTSYRCFTRYMKRLWWHDDSVALFSMLSFVIFLIGSIYLASESPSNRERVTGAYLMAVGYHTPIWGARISIVLTVIRITPWRRQRKILLWVVVIFFLQFATLTALTFCVCELTSPGWKQVPGSICVVPLFVPISQIAATVISDATLLAAPLMIVRGVRIRALRFRLFSIFSVSIATTLASLAHSVVLMVKPGIVQAISGAMEAAISVIVCNMSVIVPIVLRALDVGDPFTREDAVDMNLNTFEIAHMTLTRIELDIPETHGRAITDSDKSESGIGTETYLGVKDDQKHRLATQASDASLGNLKTAMTAKVVSLADDSDVADPLGQARSLPVVKGDQNIEVDVENNATSNGRK